MSHPHPCRDRKNAPNAVPLSVLLILAATCGWSFFAAGCAFYDYEEPRPALPVSLRTRVLDYRNGWFHMADGRQTVAEIAELYRRAPELTATLNRSKPGARPAAQTPIYVPPVHDRTLLVEVLERINRDPMSVPQKPPPLEAIAASNSEASSSEAPASSEGSRQSAARIEVIEPPRATSPTQPNDGEAVRRRIDRDFSPSNIWRRSTTHRGAFNWPVEGPVARGFNDRGIFPHRGIDILVSTPSMVRASRGGKVLYADRWKGYGKTAILDHGDGYATVYANADRILVRENDRVAAGRPIAEIGRENGSKRLFFQIRKGDEPVDPMPYLP